MENLEIWRAVVGYEGLYEVSDWGRVRSIAKGLITLQKMPNGYLLAHLYRDGIRQHCYVHRLVAEAFKPNPNNYPEVNHKDEDKLNNHADNLEWCPHKYNCRYGTRNVKVAEALSKKVYILTLDGGLCGMWPSTQECARNGFSAGNISDCCLMKKTQYKGFRWSYTSPKPLLKLPYYVIN